jgi:hypothetical protein
VDPQTNTGGHTFRIWKVDVGPDVRKQSQLQKPVKQQSITIVGSKGIVRRNGSNTASFPASFPPHL